MLAKHCILLMSIPDGNFSIVGDHFLSHVFFLYSFILFHQIKYSIKCFNFFFLGNHFTKAVKKQEPLDNEADLYSSQNDTASPRKRKPALLFSESPSPRKREAKTAATKIRDVVPSPTKRKIL